MYVHEYENIHQYFIIYVIIHIHKYVTLIISSFHTDLNVFMYNMCKIVLMSELTCTYVDNMLLEGYSSIFCFKFITNPLTLAGTYVIRFSSVPYSMDVAGGFSSTYVRIFEATRLQ